MHQAKSAQGQQQGELQGDPNLAKHCGVHGPSIATHGLLGSERTQFSDEHLSTSRKRPAKFGRSVPELARRQHRAELAGNEYSHRIDQPWIGRWAASIVLVQYVALLSGAAKVGTGYPVGKIRFAEFRNKDIFHFETLKINNFLTSVELRVR